MICEILEKLFTKLMNVHHTILCATLPWKVSRIQSQGIVFNFFDRKTILSLMFENDIE